MIVATKADQECQRPAGESDADEQQRNRPAFQRPIPDSRPSRSRERASVHNVAANPPPKGFSNFRSRPQKPSRARSASCGGATPDSVSPDGPTRRKWKAVSAPAGRRSRRTRCTAGSRIRSRTDAMETSAAAPCSSFRGRHARPGTTALSHLPRSLAARCTPRPGAAQPSRAREGSAGAAVAQSKRVVRASLSVGTDLPTTGRRRGPQDPEHIDSCATAQTRAAAHRAPPVPAWPTLSAIPRIPHRVIVSRETSPRRRCRAEWRWLPWSPRLLRRGGSAATRREHPGECSCGTQGEDYAEEQAGERRLLVKSRVSNACRAMMSHATEVDRQAREDTRARHRRMVCISCGKLRPGGGALL